MKISINFLAVVSIIFFVSFLFFNTSTPTQATSGACSGHGGVSCSAGSDSDGSVICYDGWLGSSVSYSSMAMCQEDDSETVSYSCPANSAYSYYSNSCECNSGYILDGSTCLSVNSYCEDQYGDNTYGVGSGCYCDSGYEWNDGQTACDLIVVEEEAEEAEAINETLETVAPDETIELPTAGSYDSIKKDTILITRLTGYILLQAEEHGEAWYVNPADSIRYYMKDGAVAYQMMRSFGLGITDADLVKIPSVEDATEANLVGGVCNTNSLANSVKGKILLQVQQHGEAWYIDPDTCNRIYMKDGDSAYTIMRFLSLGISNDDLSKVPSGEI